MNIAIFKLINKYFVRSIVGLICLFGVPLFFALLFFAIGEKEFVTSFPIIATVGILSSTLMIIPTLMIELRKSLILKRIGAAKISKYEFLIAIYTYFFGVICVAIIWAFILFAILGAIKPGTYDAWYGEKGKNRHIVGNAIYACLILGIMAILFSFLIGMNVKNSMVASAISFCFIFFSLFTSGLLMPISHVRQIKGLEVIAYFIPFDWPILMMQESWGVGNFVAYPPNTYFSLSSTYQQIPPNLLYVLKNDNIWEFWKPFNVWVNGIAGNVENIEIISQVAKGWNIFAPFVFIGVLTPLLPLTFKWTER